MPADWMAESTNNPPQWRDPHERSYYREQNQPSPLLHPSSFNPQSHPNSNVNYPNSLTGMSKETEEKQRRLQDSLDKVLGPDYIANRPGGGGTKLTYLEGWRAINLANEVFGYNGWFTDIKYLEVDFIDHLETGRYNIGVTAIVRVRLPDGASHEDIGFGKLENAKSKGDGLDKCKKEAVTDGLKRALRHFGKLLGNCLYDKHYLTQLSAMKASKPKFDWDSMYKPEHHALHASDPKPLPPRAVPPGIDPSSMPPPAARNAPNSNSSIPVNRPPPHPPHMQRAQTVGSKPQPQQQQQLQQQQASNLRPDNMQSNSNSRPPPPQAQPQRSATVSYNSTSNQSRPNPLDRSGTTSAMDYHLNSDDESLFAGMELPQGTAAGEVVNGSNGSSGGTLQMEMDTTGLMEEGNDSGFGEASFIKESKPGPSNSRPTPRAQPPRPLPNGRPSTSTTPSPPIDQPQPSKAPTATTAAIEQNRLAALARREQNLKAKAEAQAKLQAQQQQQQHQGSNGGENAGGGGGGNQGKNGASVSHADSPPLLRTRSKLRPPVAPSRQPSVSHSASTSSTTKPQVVRSAGVLPTLNVGNSIVSAQSIGGEGGGFVSARGVKRSLNDGYESNSMPQRAHTISTSHPSSIGRQPLGELETAEDGNVKRFRASS